jgi:hypothetical protein
VTLVLSFEKHSWRNIKSYEILFRLCKVKANNYLGRFVFLTCPRAYLLTRSFGEDYYQYCKGFFTISFLIDILKVSPEEFSYWLIYLSYNLSIFLLLEKRQIYVILFSILFDKLSRIFIFWNISNNCLLLDFRLQQFKQHFQLPLTHLSWQV